VEVLGLLGANGAGKTTVIRMLLGLFSPTSGRALRLGKAPDRDIGRKLAYVPQSMGLSPDLSMVQNLEFSAQAHEIPVGSLPPELVGFSQRLVGKSPLGCHVNSCLR
jgi:ABC-type multidrug transport system ATPase subunit